MRSPKPYTNATFTRRHDHEAGRHRPPRGPTEPRVCAACGAVYERRRWRRAEEAAARHEPVATAEATVVWCPACRAAAGGIPRGVVYVDGAFADSHGEALQRLIAREAGRAEVDNPTGRIMATTRDAAQRFVVTTTTEHLAQRLGHALQKAYKGRVRFDFSHENKFARVYWHRD